MILQIEIFFKKIQNLRKKIVFKVVHVIKFFTLVFINSLKMVEFKKFMTLFSEKRIPYNSTVYEL